jgi:hypothetical protein
MKTIVVVAILLGSSYVVTAQSASLHVQHGRLQFDPAKFAVTVQADNDFEKIEILNPDCRYEYSVETTRPSAPDFRLHHYGVAMNTYNTTCRDDSEASATEKLVRKASCLADALNELDTRVSMIQARIDDVRRQCVNRCTALSGENQLTLAEEKLSLSKIVADVIDNSISRRNADQITQEWSNIDRAQLDRLVDENERALDDQAMLKGVNERLLGNLCDTKALKSSARLYATPRFPFQGLVPPRSWDIVIDPKKKRLLLGGSAGLLIASQRDDRFDAAPLITGGYQVVVSRETKPFHGVIAVSGWLTDDETAERQRWAELVVVPSSSPPAVGLGGAYSYGRLKADAGVLFARERSLSGHVAGDIVTNPAAVTTRSKIAPRLYIGISMLFWKGH